MNFSIEMKILFSHPEMVRDLITGFVREDWAKQLDFNSLECLSGEHATDDIRTRHDDNIWRVKSANEWLYVYILLEFQSSVDKFMVVRVMTYLGLLYQDIIKKKWLLVRCIVHRFQPTLLLSVCLAVRLFGLGIG